MTTSCNRCAKTFDETELRRAIFIDADSARSAATTWSVCVESMGMLKQILRTAIDYSLSVTPK